MLKKPIMEAKIVFLKTSNDRFVLGPDNDTLLHEKPLVDATYTQTDPYTSESPDVRRCLAYWERLRGYRFAPSWAEFDWSEIPTEIIPFFGVVDVVLEPLDFVYRFWGTHHSKVHHQELAGKSVNQMRPMAESQSVFAQYRETLEARQPLLFTNIIQIGKSGIEMTEISLRLPFSDDGRAVNHIVAYSNIRNNLGDMEKAFAGT